MLRKKLNRFERRVEQKTKAANSIAGTGLFVYENNTNGHLTLPKPTASGQRVVGPKEQFQGDSYFMGLVKPPNNLLRFVKTIVNEDHLPKTTSIMETTDMNEQKLILDQPDRVTSEGTVEQIVNKQQPIQKLNDAVAEKTKQEVLLTEEPMDGVEIILG